jgi:hypothetical protein
MRRVGGRYVEGTYEEAIADIARRLNEVIERYCPDAVGAYHGNPMGFSFSATTWWTGLLDAIGTGNRFLVGSIDQATMWSPRRSTAWSWCPWCRTSTSPTASCSSRWTRRCPSSTGSRMSTAVPVAGMPVLRALITEADLPVASRKSWTATTPMPTATNAGGFLSPW